LPLKSIPLKKEKILFAVNPISGGGLDQDYENTIDKFSREFDYEFSIYKTTGKNDVQNIKKQIDKFKPDKVIAAGGDGTINMVATLLINTKIKLGIIPLGSANGLAFGLNIPTRFKEALLTNINEPYKKIDVVRVNGKEYCIHLSDIGINARIVKRFEEDGSRGMLGYGKQLFKELFSPKTYFSYQINANQVRKRSKAEMIVFGNATSYGTGVKINPHGKINDGEFEVIVIKPYPWWFIFTFIFSGFTGSLHKRRHVDIYSAKKAEIKLDREQDFQVDGEVKGKIKLLKLEVVKDALMVPYRE